MMFKIFHCNHLCPTSHLCGVCNNQPKELITGEVYHMLVTTSIEQSGWITGGGLGKVALG